MFNTGCLSDIQVQPSSAIPLAQAQRVAFLDRDGVINRAPDKGRYVLHWRQFQFADGALDMLKALANKGYRLVVVTNQQGVGKGLMDAAALAAVHRNLCAASAAQGAPMDAVFSCRIWPCRTAPAASPSPALFMKLCGVCLTRWIYPNPG